MTNNQLTDRRISELLESATEYDLTAFAKNDDLALALRELQERRMAAMDSEPVAWTDEEELRDANAGACGYLFGIGCSANKFADPRRQIMLYRHAQQAPDGEQLAIENFRSAMEGVGHIRRTLEETFGGLHGTHVEPDVLAECKAICDAIYAAYSGSSPVIPDGYVMVPKEPTAEMISSGIAAHYERSQIQIHDRPAIGPMECAYVAMLAAAPQEVK